uniref:Uncharacterized protein n=1 Tax=Rhizophora mucronata TaxID=61149 RepID=A0A2P2MXN4_RHIMU
MTRTTCRLLITSITEHSLLTEPILYHHFSQPLYLHKGEIQTMVNKPFEFHRLCFYGECPTS